MDFLSTNPQKTHRRNRVSASVQSPLTPKVIASKQPPLREQFGVTTNILESGAWGADQPVKMAWHYLCIQNIRVKKVQELWGASGTFSSSLIPPQRISKKKKVQEWLRTSAVIAFSLISQQYIFLGVTNSTNWFYYHNLFHLVHYLLENVGEL